MAFEKLEKKINTYKKAIKQGRLSEEVADEIANTIDEIESLGGEAKKKFASAVNDLKKALKQNK